MGVFSAEMQRVIKIPIETTVLIHENNKTSLSDPIDVIAYFKFDCNRIRMFQM